MRIKMKIVVVVLALACWPVFYSAAAEPGVLLYHSFDEGLDRIDHAEGDVELTLSDNLIWREDGVFGRSVGFDMAARDALLELNLEEPAPSESWTFSFFLQLDNKEALTTPRENLLTVFDQNGNPLLDINVSGFVTLRFPTGRSVGLVCSDATYWIAGEEIHLAVTFDAQGASTSNANGLLKTYWNARPFGAAAIDLGERRPASIRFGGDNLAVGVDEIKLFDTALPLPAVYELARPPRRERVELLESLSAIIEDYSNSPLAMRREAWKKLSDRGALFEAEQGKGGKIVSGWNAWSASGGGYLEGANQVAALPFAVAEAGEYTLALRYALDRRFDPMWPVRNPDAATPWSDNATILDVYLNGERISTEHLYPTGIYNGHRGDVDPWAWHNLAEGQKLELSAGEHAIEFHPVEGLAWPHYDALLVGEESGPAPPHPRWVDKYRAPPAWWVEDRRTEIDGGERVDTYTVTLRNRNDEPYSARISLEQDMLDEGQKALTEAERIDLAPREEKAFEITFRHAADAAAKTGYLRVVLWNEDSPIPMEYRLWNVIPEEFHAETPHPRLLPEPDPEMRAKFREWLETRDADRLTPELRRWAAGPDLTDAPTEYHVFAHRVNLFPTPLLGERLEILDMWMDMSEEDLIAYLPQGPAEHAGYGLCWDKVNNKVAGHWAGPSFDYRTEPEAHIWRPVGDLDMATVLTARGMERGEWSRAGRPTPDKAEIPIREGVWRREQDPDVFAGLRNLRWCMMAGLPYGSMGYQSADMPKDSGIPLLAEAYYLTGDEAYAQQAFLMARVFAREYTIKTKQFLFRMHREDRDWWGSRWHNRYMSGMGRRVIQQLGTGVLDLCWDGLDERQREVIHHNLIRFGMYEATYGPLWDDPDKMAKVNREDPPPFVPAGLVLGDPGPRRGLDDFYRLVNKMVLSDGIHICSIGTYGGTREYIRFIRMLHDLGVDVVADNPSLRNAFLNHSRFVFACGSLQPMDDGGGGQGHLGLDPTFGAPTRDQYEWGYELFEDDLFLVMRGLLEQLARAVHHRVRGVERARNMRQFYDDSPFPLREIWPPVFVAQDKGIAMLRNWTTEDPLDWIEIVFDYGKYGGRFHGHPTKLGILTAFNGQIGSQDFGDLTRGAPEGNNAWFMGGYSHNTVQVNHRHHRSAGGPVQIGELIEAGGDETIQWIDAHSDRMFGGVYMRRTTFVTDAGIVDFYLCESERENTYDWPYHNFGLASAEVDMTPVDLSGQGLLRFAEDARSAAVNGMIQVTWEDHPLTDPPRKGHTSLIGEKVYARLWALPEEGTELVMFAGPTVSSITEEKQIDFAMLRRKTDSTVFATVIEPWREETGAKIESIEKLEITANGDAVSDTDAFAIKVTRVGGIEQVFFVNYSGGEKTVGNVTTAANAASWTLDEDGNAVDMRDGKDEAAILLMGD